jgi:hypothetical protein
MRHCFLWLPTLPRRSLGAEFADWFRSLKEPGTEGAMGGSI